MSNALPLAASAIRVSEGGPHLVGYYCGAGKLTIGWGRMIADTEDNRRLKITRYDANRFLDEDIDDAIAACRRLFPAWDSFHDGMQAALISVVFNFGESKVRGYTLTGLINEGAPLAEIVDQLLEYQYTIRDDDGDGDLDAVIDRGLPVRRYREGLLMYGYKWDVAENAVTPNSLNLAETSVPWRNGGHKEVLVSRDPFADVLQSAESIRALMGDKPPQVSWPPLTAAADDDGDLDIPKRGAEPSPPIIDPDPLPEPEPEPMPETQPVKRPPSPYRDYNPNAEPKDMVMSKTFAGNALIVIAWLGAIPEFAATVPFLKHVASMSPVEMTAATSMMVLMGGLLLRWYGQVTATRPKK